MKNLLRIFGLLDVVTIILLAPQVWLLLQNINQLQDSLAIRVISYLRIILFLSLFLSAAGHLLLKKFGVITYYIQFLFRFVTLVFTFGFITYLNDVFDYPALFKLTLTLAVFGEFLRMYYTYKGDKVYN